MIACDLHHSQLFVINTEHFTDRAIKGKVTVLYLLAQLLHSRFWCLQFFFFLHNFRTLIFTEYTAVNDTRRTMSTV